MHMQFHFQDGRPKQKRHRCRNPNKIDVNSLTGEERVQIINRRNARKVGSCHSFHTWDLRCFLITCLMVSVGRWSVRPSSEGSVPLPPGEPRVRSSTRVGRRCQTVGG